MRFHDFLKTLSFDQIMTGQDDNLLKLRITSVKQETAVAKTYTFERPDGKTTEFLPGQFLTFIINTGKHDLRRSYSILSLPGEPLQVTVKKVTNGVVSRYILQHWHEGDLITSLAPSGRFRIQPQHLVKRDIFCFAAGSGIIPVIPLIRHLLDHEPQSIIHLVYSNHNETDTLFRKELDRLSEEYPLLTIHYFFSEPVQTLYPRRRLSNLTTEMLVSRLITFRKKHAAFLISGPFSYMRMLMFTLGLMGFKKENIRKESFIAETKHSGKIVTPTFDDTAVTIKLFDVTHNIIVKSGESILAAALRQGLKPPYSCDGGVCGSCVATCTSGKVFMSINEVLLDSEINEGLVLTCTGYPAADGTCLVF